jgi:reactive intermediate/imine deaminase
VRQEIRAEALHAPIGHYTDAVRFGDIVFLSGCGPTNDKLEVVGGDDAAAQARQVLANMREVLAAAGTTPQDVLRITTYLTDIEDRAKLAPLYAEFFGEARPTSATIAVTALAVPGAKVEIQAVAGISNGN